MKKVLFLSLLLVLSGCNAITTSSEDISNKVEPAEKASDSLKLFDEYEILAGNIDLNSLKAIIETDNSGNRIILFENNDGIKEFKSVFIKHDKRLKIIKFKDNESLYNNIIN